MAKVVIKETTAFVGPNFTKQDRIHIVVEDGRIVGIQPNLPGPDCTVIDGRDFFVTPGFVNSHFHPSQQLNRGLGIGVSHDVQMDLLHATDRIKEPEAKYWLSLIAILEGLKAGTTSFYSVGSEIESQVKAYSSLGVRAACAMLPKDIEAQDKPEKLRATTWGTRERLDLAQDLHKRYHGDLVRIHFGVCNVRYASDQLITGMMELAERYDVGFHMHAAEGNEYVNEVIKRTGHRYIEHLKVLDVLRPRLSLAHATKLSSEEIGFLASSGASVVHCPRSNAYLSVGMCPVAELLAAGVNVALGSDAANNNNSNEVRGEAWAAYNNLSNLHERANVIDYLTLFAMLTVNGARAIGIENDIGTIDIGKKADIVMWSKNDLPFIPGHNYLADLIFTDSCRAHTVFVNGVKVLEEYRSVLLDEEELIAVAKEKSAHYHLAFQREIKEHLTLVLNDGRPT
jgi:5-methylthioadenosine/S-adenosylhomocysteine deaminase